MHIAQCCLHVSTNSTHAHSEHKLVELGSTRKRTVYKCAQPACQRMGTLHATACLAHMLFSKDCSIMQAISIMQSCQDTSSILRLFN